MSWIKGALGGLWGYIATAGVAVLAVLTVYLKGKKVGESEVKAATAEKELENVQTAKEVEADVAVSSDESRRKRLRKYQRD